MIPAAPHATNWRLHWDLPDVSPGRCDAHRASSSALGTGGALHRDARRIGPGLLRYEPLRVCPAQGHWLSVWLSCPPTIARLALRQVLQRMANCNHWPAHLHRRVVPSGGRIDFREAFPSTWRFQWAAPHLSDRSAWSCDPHYPPASFRCLALPCFATLRPFCAALLWRLPARLEPADDLAPLAASAVRAGFPRRFCLACFPTLLRASQSPRSG